MNKKDRVLQALKPKVKSFGFTKNVLKSVAAQIADKLDITDETSDEDATAAVDKAIDAAMPYLALIQSQSTSLIDEWKKAHPSKTDDDDESSDDDDQSDNDPKPNRQTKPRSGKDDGTSKALSELTALVKGLKDEITAIKDGKRTDTRRSKLEALLKDTGAFGEITLRNFDRMKFDTDDAFDEFFGQTETDLKAFNKERTDNGLSSLGVVPGAGADNKPKGKTAHAVLTDDEIKAMYK